MEGRREGGKEGGKGRGTGEGRNLRAGSKPHLSRGDPQALSNTGRGSVGWGGESSEQMSCLLSQDGGPQPGRCRGWGWEEQVSMEFPLSAPVYTDIGSRNFPAFLARLFGQSALEKEEEKKGPERGRGGKALPLNLESLVESWA